MLKRSLPFIVGYLVLFVLMVALEVVYPKGELHIMLNSVHTKVGDVFFRFYSILAEWPLYVLAAFVLLASKKWWVVFYAASECVCPYRGGIEIYLPDAASSDLLP